MTKQQVCLVEEQLARAFLFNTAFSEKSEPFFATDMASRVILRRASDDVVQWDKVWQGHGASGFACMVYSSLSMAGGEDGSKRIYRPLDVTVISIGAVAKAQDEIAGEQRLRQRAKPKTRNRSADEDDLKEEVEATAQVEVDPELATQDTGVGT